jgi:hypothetical protein
MAELHDAFGDVRLNAYRPGALPPGVINTGYLSYTAAPLPPEAAGIFADALRTGHLPAGPAELLIEPRETLRSATPAAPQATVKSFAPDGIRVVSDQPEFRWSPLSDVTAWRITVTDEDLNEIAHSGLIHDTVWTPETPLPRLRPLLWQVAALRNGVWTTAPSPPETSPRFEVVSADAARQIATAQKINPPSHLLLASLYAQAGLHKEAAAELDALAALNPGSALASSLRTALLATPGRK